ncbi:MAG: hypothetical protein PHP25_05125 [Candidatus Moranbacteria bacterium]|nr:hypothetical protein [Candidatus Moranbacteria bacterium]
MRRIRHGQVPQQVAKRNNKELHVVQKMDKVAPSDVIVQILEE